MNAPKKKRKSALALRPIDLDEHPRGARTDLRLPLWIDSLSNRVTTPFVVVRGAHPGPTVGISAAIHGDELNGIKIIHHVLERVDPQEMYGSLVCAPVANVPAYQAGQRRFPEDEVDLNHQFPGKKDGKASQQYAHALLTTFLTPCDYLIDIHTASQGRINSMYVRADLHNEQAREMALLMDPQIILHGRSGDGTLRNAARVRGVPAITVEAGNPMVFQGRMVLEGEQGVFNILIHLGVIRGEKIRRDGPPPVICKSSKWLRTRAGGLLETQFELCDVVAKKQLMADIVDPFGYTVESYTAPYDGIVIGMSRNPAASSGTRFCHLGMIGEPAAPKKTGATPRPSQRVAKPDAEA